MTKPGAEINDQQRHKEIRQGVKAPNIAAEGKLNCAQFHCDSTEGLAIARLLRLEDRFFSSAHRLLTGFDPMATVTQAQMQRQETGRTRHSSRPITDSRWAKAAF
ncbi:hypothetical protein DNK49_13520 [Azoarcus communis]|uniref:Uncharacterized protein n=1 Tax=Parazoarcus communis SWub3 = DSM 12120 TaxID=1121029 RepID=A0A323UUF2_9RHOO|nr:hypothetical protein DNK49_13520 [Azoarcus communis] [Parazoarcus communis SWub3 = DSM 12120]